MKFGVTMLPNNLADVASGARLAEEMGFDYVGIADSQSLARELYVTLGVVAAAKANAPSARAERAGWRVIKFRRSTIPAIAPWRP